MIDLPERCDQCRFVSDEYTTDHALTTLGVSAQRWRWMVDGIDASVLQRRPEPATWSVVEYVSHSARVTSAMGRLLSAMARADGQVLAGPGEVPDPEPADFPAAVDDLFRQAERLHIKALSFDESVWARTVTVDGVVLTAGDVLRHAVHDATHHLMDGGRVLHRLGAGAVTETGAVAGVFASRGGVPKQPMLSATVGLRGVDGDRQADTRHHGRPFQALCLWSADVVAALRAEGHPIEPGFAGENISVAEVSWPAMRPGVRLQVGDVLCEVSSYATPCKKNAAWFTGGDFRRMAHDRHPGWSRIYASVLAGGAVTPGDVVVVEP